MTNKHFVFLLFILYSVESLGQTNIQNAFVEKFSQEREYVLMHVNKEVFVTSETLWFTGYITTAADDGSDNESLNLRVGVYDALGKLVKTQINYIENGVATGSILLDLPAGHYYIKAQTNWMLNDPKTSPFVLKIRIVNYGVAQADKGTETKEGVVEQDAHFTSIAKMTVNMLAPIDAIVSFETSSERLSSLKEADFFLAIHNNESLQLASLVIDRELTMLKIPKKKLFPGLNTVLMLDSKGELLQEQLVYNVLEFEEQERTTIRLEKMERDTISMRLSLAPTQKGFKNLSVSVLPTATKAVVQQSSLSLQNALRDVRSHNLKNGKMPWDRKSLAALNELLKSAKNTFDWNTLLEKEKRRIFNRECGFVIEGRIEKWNGGEGQITLYQRSNGQFLTTQVNEGGDFSFLNAYIERNEKLNFSLIRNGKNVDEPKIEFEIKPVFVKDTLKLGFVNESFVESKAIIKDKEEVFAESSAIGLEEVQLKGATKKEPLLVQNEQLAANDFFESKKIGSEETKKFPFLSSYLRKLGFRVVISPKTGLYLIRARNPVNPDPFLFYDGVRETDGIPDQSLSGIDEIYYEINGLFGSQGGTIYIYTKKGSFVGSETTAVVSLSNEVGFEKPQTYFNETNGGRMNAFAKLYGAVFWDGNVNLDTNGEALLVVPTLGLEGVRVVIQGIDQQGSFFSEHKIIYFED